MDSATRASIHNLIEGLPTRVIEQHGSPHAIEQKISDVLFPHKRPRGRPKGSKNKTNTQQSPINEVDQEKKPRGRPKGSKNKTKEPPTNEVVQEKRPRGRPKGSKNKPKTQNIQC